MAKPPGPPRRITCYHCGRSQDVSGRTTSTVCPACSKTLTVEDIVVKSYLGVRNVETCGRLIVTKKGRVVAQQRIVAHEGIELEGKLECREALVSGPVTMGGKAEWRGDLTALSLAVAEGATIRRGYFTVPENWLEELRARPPDEDETRREDDLADDELADGRGARDDVVDDDW